MLQGDYVEKYVKLLTVTSIKAVKCISPLLYIPPRIYTYIHTYIHTHIIAYIHTHIHTYTHTYIHIHTYIHSYIHTRIHTYVQCSHYAKRRHFIWLNSCLDIRKNKEINQAGLKMIMNAINHLQIHLIN